MNVCIVGLGLIGGSLAKTIKKNTNCKVYGIDLNSEVVGKAVSTGAIDGECKDLFICDVIIVALYPQATVEFIKNNYVQFNKGAIVLDACGVKEFVCDEIFPLAHNNGFTFIGGHPMAGIEASGFDASQDTLFNGASMILVPDKDTDEKLEFVKKFFLSIGFGKIQVTTAEKHDKMIALTSQLAHVLSSAYVKSPSALEHSGFSAGSFKDMTRVAKLNETMWAELFLENKQNLLFEMNQLIERLGEYKLALENNDRQKLEELLKEGTHIKLLTETKQ